MAELKHFDIFFKFLLTFNESLNVVMSTSVAPPGMLKIKVFRNDVYDVIISVYELTKKTLSLESYYIVDAFM